MIAARDVLERRLVALLEQQAGVSLPPPWDTFRPRAENLRPAAALLLRIATMKDRDTMAAELRAMAGRVRQNREGRDGGEQGLWEPIAEALDRLGEGEEGEQGLYGLKIWSGSRAAVSEARHALVGALPRNLEAGEAFLTDIARALLRALARRWMDEARKQAQP